MWAHACVAGGGPSRPTWQAVSVCATPTRVSLAVVRNGFGGCAGTQGDRGRRGKDCEMIYHDFRANFTVTLCCEVNSGRKWEYFSIREELQMGRIFKVVPSATRYRTRSAAWRARARGA